MSPARVPLILRPTPLHRLDRASAVLGVDLWIKRDDLTGFALGGNKGRKLEFLVADWMRRGVEVVVSCGAAHSNFLRQLAAACQIAGIRCEAAVMVTPFDQTAGKPEFDAPGRSGNWLLTDQLGAHLHFYPDDDWEVLYGHMETLAQMRREAGERVEVVPVGGSSALGAFAFVEAAEELTETFDQIFFASSSGSTQVGLATYFAGKGTEVLGIACDPEPEIAGDFAAISSELHTFNPDLPALRAEDFHLDFGYVGDGYGVPSHAGTEANEWLVRHEGIFLDPIYTAKAFAALLDRARKGKLANKVLFWHTGGIPSLFNA